MPLLAIKNLSCVLGNNTILKNVSLEVNSGDFLGVLGPNGSGKTTLLKCISGILKPVSGQVLLEDRPLEGYSRIEIARTISVVPQGVEAGFQFPVAEFVALGRIPHLKPFRGETDADRSIVAWAMEATGITSMADRYFGELSGGERQRAVIAQALAQQPRLLLLDEPASFLDIAQEAEIFNLVKKLNRQYNIAVMVVLHDLNLASRYCDSAILLHHGTVFAQGAPPDILTPEKIRDVYHTEVETLYYKGAKYIVPVVPRQEEIKEVNSNRQET